MLTSINPQFSDTTLHYTKLRNTTLHYTILHYIAGQVTLHTFRLDAIPLDHTHPGRCSYTHTTNKIQTQRAFI